MAQTDEDSPRMSLAAAAGRGKIDVRVRVVEESWEDLEDRLGRTLDELETMLERLQSRPPGPGRRKRERELKRWLRAMTGWIEAVLELGRPESPEEAEELVHELYHFDLERPGVVDRFRRLLEEAGEAPVPE